MNYLKTSTIRFSLVFNLLFCSFFIISFGQIKKGFKYLDNHEWEKAKKAFEKDLKDSDKAPFAQFGLMKIALRDAKRNVQTLAEIVNTNEDLLDAFDNPTEQQAKWMKGYKITKKTPQNARFSALNRICNIIDEENTLAFYDAFAEKNSDLLPEMDTCLRDTRIRLVEDAYKRSNDYDELTSLYNNHRKDLQLKNLRFTKDFDNKIIRLFVSKYGYEQLRRFKKDHPRHWVSSDCWLENFADSLANAPTAKAKGRASLRFLNDFPHSLLDNYAIDLARTYAVTEGAPDELLRMQYIRLQDSLVRASRKLDSAAVPKFATDLRRWLAYPFTCSHTFYLVKSLTQTFLDLHADTTAAAILTEIRQRYPDGNPKNCKSRYTYYEGKQMWFDSATHHILKKRHNISREKLPDLNTPLGDEISPVISLDGTTLFFGAANRKENIEGEDIFVAYGSGKLWSKPRLVKELSGKGDQTPLALTQDGRTMLLSVNGKLRQSKFNGLVWSTPQPLGNLDKVFTWTGKATMASNGKTVILEASYYADAEQSRASMIGLYLTTQNDTGGWQRPIRLPAPVNIFQAQTRAPFLAVDDRTLYFSTDGIEGLGESDLFVSKRLDDSWVKWSNPVNLGKEFNSTEDDWGLNLQILPNGRTAYWAAKNFRDEIDTDAGSYDIYAIELPLEVRAEPMVLLKSRVVGDRLLPTDFTGGKAIIIDATSGETVAKVPINADGTISVLLPLGSRYKLVYEKESFFPNDKIIDLSNTNSTQPNVVNDTTAIVTISNMVDSGKYVPIKGLLFETNSASLKEECYADLDRLVLFLKNKAYIVELIGHTDNVGTPEHNKDLSLSRANSVRDYLVSKGFKMDWLKIDGKGSDYPIAPNDTETNKQLNRRVEVALKPILEPKSIKKQ